MNRGKKEGDAQETDCTKLLNLNIDHYSKVLNIQNNDDLFAIRVTNKKPSTIHSTKVLPKSDIIICRGLIPKKFIIESGYYLEEELIKKFNLKLVKNSGISVKLKNSKKYTITKMGISTFNKLFNDLNLGCGASIYCNSENEIYKNMSVIKAWGTDEKQFLSYFREKIKSEIQINYLADLKKIKSYSNNMIKEIILKNKNLYDSIIKGIGVFEDPFCCNYMMKDDELSEIKDVNFKITTGSGRSKGVFTIVVKPSQ